MKEVEAGATQKDVARKMGPSGETLSPWRGEVERRLGRLDHPAGAGAPPGAGWRRECMPTLADDAFATLAPDWVCEVLSPSTEDVGRAEKMPVYARERVSLGPARPVDVAPAHACPLLECAAARIAAVNRTTVSRLAVTLRVCRR